MNTCPECGDQFGTVIEGETPELNGKILCLHCGHIYEDNYKETISLF
jgi:transcription initiation factor TFIIIB Brf1 subunit/transcription initiation factor TFIIB